MAISSVFLLFYLTDDELSTNLQIFWAQVANCFLWRGWKILLDTRYRNLLHKKDRCALFTFVFHVSWRDSKFKFGSLEGLMQYCCTFGDHRKINETLMPSSVYFRTFFILNTDIPIFYFAFRLRAETIQNSPFYDSMLDPLTKTSPSK